MVNKTIPYEGNLKQPRIRLFTSFIWLAHKWPENVYWLGYRSQL